MIEHDVSNIKQYHHELTCLAQCVQEAGAVIQKIRAQGFNIHHKNQEQNNPVTEADEAANALIVKTLQETYPDDLVISEECSAQGSGESQRVWYVDPIDGTKEFIKGLDEWSVMIGMAIQGRPVLGVVYQPELEKLYYAAKGEGAYISTVSGAQSITVRSIQSLEEAILVESRSHASSKVQSFVLKYNILDCVPQGSLGLKLALIAEGKADIYLNFSGHTHLWDVCAPEIILQEAGGVVQSFEGESIVYRPDMTQVKFHYRALTPAVLKMI